jgi:O-antigen/teichoic acid export membrane protein
VVSRTSRAVSGGAVFSLQMILRLGTPILISPLVAKLAGAETLGIYSVIMQVSAYLLLLDLRMGEAIIREIAQSFGYSGKGKKLDCIATTGALFLLVSGIVIGFLTYMLSLSLTFWLKAEEETLRSGALSLSILAVWMPIKFPLSLSQYLLFARQKITYYGFSGIIGDVIRAILAFSFVLLGWGLTGLISAIVISEIGTLLLCLYWARDEISAIDWKTRPSSETFHNLLKIGIPMSVMSFGDCLTFHSQSIIIGAIFDAKSVAAFYATRTPGHSLSSILWRMLDSIMPGVNEIYGQQKKDALRSVFFRIIGYTLGAALWLGAGVWAFNRLIVEFWLGWEFYVSGLMTIAVALLVPIATFKNIATKFIIVEGKLAVYTWFVLAEGIITLMLAVILGLYWGMAGVMWSIVLAHMVTIGYLCAKLSSLLEISVREFLKIMSLRAIRCSSVGVVSCFLYIIGHDAHYSPLSGLGSLVLILILGSVGFIRFGLVQQDKMAMLEIFNAVILRKNGNI